MPNIILPVPETEHTVLRPIVRAVTQRLIEMTGMDKGNIHVAYPSESGKIAQPGSTLTPLPGEGPQRVLMPFNEQISIEVQEEFEEERMSSTAVRYPENRLIFLDDRIDTVVRPVYSMVRVTINFRYRAPDREAAERWRDVIHNRLNEGADQHLHDLTYGYRLPDVVWVILEEIHRLREATEGYGETFDEFITDNSTSRMTTAVTMAGTQPVRMIGETQIFVPGMFDFTVAPDKGEKEDGGEARTATFSYKFSYDKPTAINMSYPLVVHNSIIKYRDEKPYQPENRKYSYTSSMYDLAHFQTNRETFGQGIQVGVAIPNWDEFHPVQVLDKTVRVFTGLALIDPKTPDLLLNVGQLGDIELNKLVLDFILSERQYITKHYKSILSLSWFKNRVMQPSGSLILDANGDVRTAEPTPSLRQYYHVRLALLEDMRLADPVAIDRARDHGYAFIEIIKALDPTLEDRGLLPEVIGGGAGYIPRADADKVIDAINKGVRDGAFNQRRLFALVQTLFIKTGN